MFTLYNQALLESERQSIPLLGIATNRRTLAHLGEVFREENITTLMCFVCGCKHLRHNGSDKFGTKIRKGTIDFRDDVHDLVNKMFTHEDYNHFWEYNLSMKRFKDRFGEAVKCDPGLQSQSFEWKRKIYRQGVWEEALCCPEDVQRGPSCRHGDEVVCSRCRIPFCNDCWNLGSLNRSIPKALCCDNFIGYAHQFFGGSESYLA